MRRYSLRHSAEAALPVCRGNSLVATVSDSTRWGHPTDWLAQEARAKALLREKEILEKILRQMRLEHDVREARLVPTHSL